MRFNLNHTVLLVVAAVVMISPILVAAPSAVPHQFTYQGRLTDNSGAPVPDGLHQAIFVIYDSPATEPARQVWSSGKVEVVTKDGLFSIDLGAAPQPEPTLELFTDTSLWLGITIEGDPEMGPRSKLTSVPFAFKAEQAIKALTSISALTAGTATTAPGYLPLSGGTVTGTLSLIGAGGTTGAKLETMPSGNLTLYDGTPSANQTVVLTGNYGGGGSLHLGHPGDFPTIQLDAYGTGDASVRLPSEAISSSEIQDNSLASQDLVDEPGIAAMEQLWYIPTYLPCTGVPADILTLSITIPAPGYIVIDARCQVILTLITGLQGYVQIDEDSGGLQLESATTFQYTLQTPGGSQFRFPVSTYRVYFKPAGTYTFRLEGSGPCSVALVDNPMMKAIYYPTSYGSVVTTVSSSEAGQFEKAEAVSVPTGPDGKGPATTMYQVDLRELELKAAKSQAETERLQRQLAEEKLRQAQPIEPK